MLIANSQWAFILANYAQLKEIEALDGAPIENMQETYLKAVFWTTTGSGLVSYASASETNAIGGISAAAITNDWFIKASIYETNVFKPIKIVLPAINQESPIVFPEGDVDGALNRGVVLFNPVEDDNRPRTGTYIFWHSSSYVSGPFQYVFAKLPRLKRGDVAALESDDTVKLYELVDSYIRYPSDLSKLPDSDEKLYLITCYPLLTSYKRYVAEFKLVKTISKNDMQAWDMTIWKGEYGAVLKH